MLRRRRPLKNGEIHFSFDSFLDLVTNVVGIIIRLILVTWVGARAYHTSMQWLEIEAAPPTAVPKVTDDPLHHRIELSKRDLDDAKTHLLEKLKSLQAVEQQSKSTEARLAALLKQRDDLETERKRLEALEAERGSKFQLASLSVDQVRQRSKKLLEEIKAVEAAPPAKKELKYHAPVSRAVQSEEMNFECKSGRVTYIDLPTFLQEYTQLRETIEQELAKQWRVERQTAPVGPYRLRYVVERERTVLDSGARFRYGLSAWEVEPLAADRGETVEQALRAKSEFRQLTDALDPNLTTVTFWVYPDSFELFRQLRDHLYERGHDVAGRPLPMGAPIAASRNGTKSRGQ